ncbi:ATPase with role in protein import into the ER [Ceratobasidium sp. 392]|nr:ATPase with role in protein import into the ER [Ceratobasidium sp. 392]
MGEEDLKHVMKACVAFRRVITDTPVPLDDFWDQKFWTEVSPDAPFDLWFQTMLKRLVNMACTSTSLHPVNTTPIAPPTPAANSPEGSMYLNASSSQSFVSSNADRGTVYDSVYSCDFATDNEGAFRENSRDNASPIQSEQAERAPEGRNNPLEETGPELGLSDWEVLTTQEIEPRSGPIFAQGQLNISLGLGRQFRKRRLRSSRSNPALFPIFENVAQINEQHPPETGATTSRIPTTSNLLALPSLNTATDEATEPGAVQIHVNSKRSMGERVAVQAHSVLLLPPAQSTQQAHGQTAGQHLLEQYSVVTSTTPASNGSRGLNSNTVYYICNKRRTTIARAPRDATGDDIVGSYKLKDIYKGHRWKLDRFRHHTKYSIYNVDFKIYAARCHKNPDHLIGRDEECQWFITQVSGQENWIADLAGAVFWGLDDDAEDTPVGAIEPRLSGKSESITITNEKGRLSQEEIDRMVREAEEFASEDEAQRKRIEALSGLQNFIWGLKSQLGDQEGLGGKISDEDKKTILATVKETSDWLEENGQSATSEDLEEKLQEVQAVVNPITGKLYGGAGGASGEGSGSHDEL